MAKFNNFMKGFVGKEVCIGAKDGTNYMYIGPWNEGALTILNEQISSFKERTERSIPVLYKNMENKAKFSYEFKDTEIKGKPVSAEYLLVQHCDEIGKLVNRYRKAKAYSKSFKKLEDRNVVDIYNRDTDGRTVIMISGSESGKFWMREEVQQYEINKLLKEGMDIYEISQELGYSIEEIEALLKNYEENKEKAKS